jgi:hypothetical protein
MSHTVLLKGEFLFNTLDEVFPNIILYYFHLQLCYVSV